MTTNELVKAIKKLKPTAEFSLTENDYNTIKWDVLEGDAPSIDEINNAIKEIKDYEKNEVELIANAKADLLAKLGITEDEAKLLVG